MPYRNLLLLLGIFCVSLAYTQDPLWMRYPAISPDGSTIAFAYKGDIYTVPVSGGNAQILTTSDAYDYAPVWSHDGSHIAFASDRYGNFDVFIMPATGGAALRLTYSSDADRPTCFSADDKTVFFTSSRIDDYASANFPVFNEYYAVSASGGRERLINTMPIVNGQWNKAGDKLLFEDRKGYEFYWRKHHTSSVTRDIWIWDKTADAYTQLTNWSGEDLYPNYSPDEKYIFYTSEMDGTANIWMLEIAVPTNKKQITHFEKNPVRFVTVAQNGTLCFGYDGEIYTSDQNGNSKKVQINILNDDRYTNYSNETFTSGATEYAASPDGKEVAFIVRGEVYVASVEAGTTRRITNTPGQERNVSFSPDGKKILYASERGNIWGIYQTRLADEKDMHFYNSGMLIEDSLVVNTNNKEAFQPAYSPDGTMIAYLEERTTLKVMDLKTKVAHVVLPAEKNYSYADGDQYFNWSPDSKYLLVQFLLDNNWLTQIGLVSADGKGEVINLTKSGYDNFGPQWGDHGKNMIFFSSKNGLRAHANYAAQTDIYALYFSQEAFDRTKLSKEEWENLKAEEAKEKEDAAKKADEDKNKKDDKNKKAEEKPMIDTVHVDWKNIDDRKVRLTEQATNISSAVLSPDGEILYYIAEYEDGYDLYAANHREHETKQFLGLGAKSAYGLSMDSSGTYLFFVADGNIVRVTIADASRKDVAFSADMMLDASAERSYMFEHMWRQVQKKFYVEDLHHVDWNYYKDTYSKFLPYINNGYDFSEMVSEMLGELNCSHTGCYYRGGMPKGDQTASLGIFMDNTFMGSGLRVAEILENGPLDNAGSKIKPGVIITHIDGNEIGADTDYFPFLNRKIDKPVILTLKDEKTNATWTETVKPVSNGVEEELLAPTLDKKSRT